MDNDNSISFLENSRFIANVLHRIKSGKEADVYCCEAQSTVGVDLLAAKVYRPFEQRSFRNDKVYQEGRFIKDTRLRRAYNKKSHVGRKAQFNNWVTAEYDTIELLHSIGARVPTPYESIGSAIVMEYIGTREQPAPTLNRINLGEMEARKILDGLLREIKIWYQNQRIHSDLSAYNILYWEGRITIIDFPQAVDPNQNVNAFNLLLRDIENIADYFRRFNSNFDPLQVALSIWES